MTPHAHKSDMGGLLSRGLTGYRSSEGGRKSRRRFLLMAAILSTIWLILVATVFFAI